MNKKPLDEILRVSWRVATAPNESVKWRPVGLAKDAQRFPRSFIRSGLTCLQNDRPVRRFERRTTFLEGARNRFRNRRFSLRLLTFAIKIRVRGLRILTRNHCDDSKDIGSLRPRRGLIKLFVICSGVDVDCRSGEIEGD